MKLRLYAGTINYHESDEEWQNLHADVTERPIWRRDVGPVDPEFYIDFSSAISMTHLADLRFHEIVCHHVLEHMHPEQATNALANFFEYLRPGGVLDVEVPDFNEVCYAYANGDLDEEGAQQWVYGEKLPHHSEPDTHRSLHTAASLLRALRVAGFEEVPERIEAGYAARYRAVKP